MLCFPALVLGLGLGVFPDPANGAVTLTVGQTAGDLRGTDNRVIQAAIDYVARLGGGTVTLLPGTYELADSVHLRSHVTLRGGGDGVVLRKDAGFQVPLTTDGDYGEAQVSVAAPERWRPGMGLCIGDNATGGFLVTVATVVAVKGHDLLLDTRIHGGDMLVARQAWASHTFAPIEAREVENVVIENLIIDGNRAQNPAINGCVGGGIHTLRCRQVAIRGCRVRDVHGDGISFQNSPDVMVEDCEVNGCSDLGLHPGSGSQRPRVSRCHSHHNGGDGMFVCWRVRHGVFSGNRLEDNGRHGLSIGHKDTDNLFEGNLIRRNGAHGVYFRPEPDHLAAHRNTFRGNTIEDNGPATGGGSGFHIDGATKDLVFEGNTVRDTGAHRQTLAVWVGPQAARPTWRHNQVSGHRDGELGGPGATAP